jgi:type III pantothenate kinase
MLLLIDAGNTRIKWALLESASAAPLGAWNALGVLAHEDMAALAQIWRDLPITCVLLSNVAGAVVRERLQQALSPVAGSLPLTWFSATPFAAGLTNRYRNPAQLGCDRFAAAIGARALFPQQALIIANCGTATTIDGVSAAGDFLGGMILPGLALMASSLSRNTAQLPQVMQNKRVVPALADNTDDAILCGCSVAQSGAIAHAVTLHGTLHGPVRCILSGGAAAAIAPALLVPHQIVDNLVLIGLQAVAAWNANGSGPENECGG